MKILQNYFDGINESSDWAALQPAFDAAFHPDLVILTSEGERNRQQWVEAVTALLAEGTKTSDFEVTGREGDTVFYRVTLTKQDGTKFQAFSKGFLKDGKFVRVEPVDSDAHARMTGFFVQP
jgi:hypothetical protein